MEISSQSRDLQKIHDILAQTPDIRSEKVAALKKAVAEGRYQVSAENIAAEDDPGDPCRVQPGIKKRGI